MNVNSNAYTYTFATVMVVLVAALLSGASLGLKSKQESNVKQEKMQSILASVGVQVDRSEAQSTYDDVIKQVLTIKGGNIVSEDRETGFNVDMAKAIKLSNMEREAPLYVANKDGETFYIVPMRGKGLWGPVWGFVAFESDGNTVIGATFDHKSETPGLGAEIATPMFTDQFPGKKISDAGEFKSISVVKAGTSSGDYAVDGISGGTITSNGVNDMMVDCLAPYAEYFKKI
ncbi:MAG: NADH:ubiquinone reductase (Na(+)-transporting) subunit C [Bacteroidota bacterium]|nr:NADH:ubiquinone reductase (Na(+)-transporting) subunit C [Bacteroidota bacterium]